LATLVVALVLLVAGVGIAIQSVREILVPHHSPEPFTLVILVLVVATKELMYRRLNRAGREIGSQALEADAWHHRSDALTSLAAFIGISIALIAGEGYEAADDWAALVACGVIVYNGLRLFRRALAEVMDIAVPTEVEVQVRQIAVQVDGVLALDKCRVRRTGLTLFVDIQVIVDANLSVRRGHEIGHEVKDVLLASPLSIVDVNVHVEPSR
jgi:cation diffusion facilitator family transporter